MPSRRNNIQPNGPWKQTRITDFYLDLWNPPEIPKKRTDKEITIEPKYHKKPRLLANDIWGDESLWWVFAMRNVNKIKDPIEDLVSGMTIFIPDDSYVRKFTGRR